MTHTAQALIAEAMTALEKNNLDAAWHFMRQAQNVAYAIAADEREECAKVCEVHAGMARHSVWMAEECAALIRARKQA